MAIDTREKRASIIAICCYPMAGSVTSNASPDAEWRQEAGYGYAGIAAASPGGSSVPVFWHHYQTTRHA